MENEGFEKIEVKDNGKGIRSEDVPYMCQCRYTSKIKDFGDLDHLNSYGFRGEALSSLCAVSQVTVTTKTDCDEIAKTYSFDSDGIITSSRVSHLNIGTIVIVQGLFKNLPVRRQFLTSGKKKAHEFNAVANIVKSFGLIQPSLRIVLNHNKFRIWQKTAVTSVQECLVQVIPHTVSKYLHEINYTEDNLKIQLIVPSKDCYVWNTCYGVVIDPINLFVNSRPVKNKHIQKAVQEEIHQFFGSTIPKNKNPFCLIAITLPTNCVDVNLEPNKTKVIIKEMEHVIRVLKDQLIRYYIGALEPPKPSTDENLSDNGLKRKSAERTPVKAKVAKKTDKKENITPKKIINESQHCVIDERIEESVQLRVDSEFHPQTKGSCVVVNETNNENRIDEMMISSTSLNTSENDLCQTVLEEGSRSLNLEENLNDLDSVLNRIETDLSSVRKSELSIKDISVSIDCPEKQFNNSEELVGVMSSDESSVDSFTTEVLQRISEDFKKSSKGDNADMKTSSQKEVVEHKENEIESKDKKLPSGVNMNEITLSQWSRGDVKLNGQVIESSIKIGKEEDLIKRKLDSIPHCSSNDHSSSQGVLSERSISSQMGCKQLSGFTKFAKEMRSKIIQQTPGITFTAVAAELASRWRDLHEDEKRNYENRAKENKEKPKLIKMPMKIKDPTYRPKPVSIRYNPPAEVEGKKFIKTISLDLSIDKLKVALEKRINYQPPSRNLIATLEDNVLLIYEQGNIISASIERIKEAIVLHNNLEQIKISLKVLDTRVPIFQSDLDPDLWNILDSLETNFDDTFKTIIVIVDDRITNNGFRIEKSPGIQENKYYITDVPSDIEYCGLNELKEILQFISLNNCVKLKDCRPTKILNFIKKETLKDKTLLDSHMLTDRANVMDIYRYWSENLKAITRNCPHFRPVCKQLFPCD
uniref:Putative dna mismatch repair protein n=1 Tax=Panstrongylus lignarius TaxID=156445 RepID=A0A224X6P8_9HEMI